jgi:transcriptional regulator with XRE-family HTH domain
VFESAEAAAEALGMPGSTYRQYERGPDSSRFAHLDEEYARTFAKKFKVDWVWLLTGVGSPQGETIDEASEELLDIYQRLGSTQQQLLIELARNMSVPGNVVSVETLPSAPLARRPGKRAG